MLRTIETKVHGRFLHEDRGPERLLVGFHGYAETADVHLEELNKLGLDGWSLVAIQALHPFYTRTGSIVASWMTSLDRELAIEDNVAYIKAVLATLPVPRTLAFLGFSQGAAMAARAAAFTDTNPGALVLLGGDIPPDVAEAKELNLPPVLLGRGSKDDWYTEEKFTKDLSFLDTRTRVTRCVYAGGHEFTDAFRDAVRDFLGKL